MLVSYLYKIQYPTLVQTQRRMCCHCNVERGPFRIGCIFHESALFLFLSSHHNHKSLIVGKRQAGYDHCTGFHSLSFHHGVLHKKALKQNYVNVRSKAGIRNRHSPQWRCTTVCMIHNADLSMPYFL